jgi:DNA-binding MarR family transcriptional regulator
MPPPPFPPGEARAGDRAADALARVAPLLARWIERLLAASDPPLTPAQHQALRAVAEGASGADMARRAGVSPAAVSQLLAGLEEAGLVRRERGDDRRRQVVSLTAPGEAALASADALLRERISPALADLPPPEADALARSLASVLSVLAGTPPPPRPPRPPRPGARPRPPRS